MDKEVNKIKKLEDEILSLHRQLAHERLRSDQGWERYENARLSERTANQQILDLTTQLAR